MSNDIQHLLLRRRNVLKGLGGAAFAPLLSPLFTSSAFAATTLDAIKAAGVLRVGCEAVLPPFTFREGGEIVGYDVDLIKLICEPLGVQPEMIDTAWSGIIPALYADRFDVIMSQMTYTAERLEKVGFAIPYVDASLAMLIRTEDVGSIATVEDLRSRKLGVQLGSPGEILQGELNEKWTSEGGESFTEVKTYDDYPAAYMALTQGSVDAVFNALPTLAEVVKTGGDRYTIVTGIGSSRWAGIAAQKESVELIAYLDEQMRALKASDQIYALQEKWFGMRMELPDDIPAV
ncbi:MAG: transporter substrate-binding domain-containing protein [Devosia sp.]